MTRKIFRSTLIVAAVVLLCCLAVVVGILYQHFTDVQIKQLKDQLSIAVTATEQYGNAFLENVDNDNFRLTWISPDGSVLFDTKVDTTTMANHVSREEFMEALETGSGSSIRDSETLIERTFYEASRLYDGTVLRISSSSATVASLMLGMLFPLIFLCMIAIVVCIILANRVAGKIVEPINNLDLENPLQNTIYPEITPLLRRINKQHLQISQHIDEIERKKNEFQLITANMQDGLIVLSSDGTILSINAMARKLFSATEENIGKNIFSTANDQRIRDGINNALDKGHGTAEYEIDGMQYHMDMSQILSNGSVIGVAILIFDITERAKAEKARREFSANVSHELKSPLQAIIGSAELMENGLVKTEDLPRFTGHIRKEAARLLNLIEDIIRLSQLDEGVKIPMESIDLAEISSEVISSLIDKAADKAVRLELTGEQTMISGVKRLIQEIIFNLCDNAIKYNVHGGKVTVTVGTKENRPFISVADTGIGIPKEDQNHVFERFYRVDKSHSRQSGGTGLGLSIVKHAVSFHNADIHLESDLGSGTCITVTF